MWVGSDASNIGARLEGLSALKDMVAQASSFRERILPFVHTRLKTSGGDTDNHLQLSTLLVCDSASLTYDFFVEQLLSLLISIHISYHKIQDCRPNLLDTQAEYCLLVSERINCV
jgi:hypothetical protein